MSLFSHNNDIDYDRLRKDLMDEYAAQSAAFSEGFGFLEMCDAEEAGNDQLLEWHAEKVSIWISIVSDYYMNRA